LIGFKLSSQTI